MRSSPLAVLTFGPLGAGVVGAVWSLAPDPDGGPAAHRGVFWMALIGLLFGLACAPQVALVDLFLARTRPDGSSVPSTARPLLLLATGASSGFLSPLVLWLPLWVTGQYGGSRHAAFHLATVAATAGVAVAVVAMVTSRARTADSGVPFRA